MRCQLQILSIEGADPAILKDAFKELSLYKICKMV